MLHYVQQLVSNFICAVWCQALSWCIRVFGVFSLKTATEIKQMKTVKVSTKTVSCKLLKHSEGYRVRDRVNAEPGDTSLLAHILSKDVLSISVL